MDINTLQLDEKFESSFDDFKLAGPLIKEDRKAKLLARIEVLAGAEDGLEYLFQRSPELTEAGIFDNTAWNDPDKLVPQLVGGTFRAGHPSATMELLSNLRMLNYAMSTAASSAAVSAADAEHYLEEVIVNNLDLAFQQATEELRVVMTESELQKTHLLFQFLFDHLSLNGIKSKLAEEVAQICSQRPVVTQKARRILALVEHRLTLTDEESDQQLAYYLRAVSGPSEKAAELKTDEAYKAFLEIASEEDLQKECEQFGYYMEGTGIVNRLHALLLNHVLPLSPKWSAKALALNANGIAELNKNYQFVSQLIVKVISADNSQCIYGLSRMLNRNLFSRNEVRNALNTLMTIKLHPVVEETIRKSDSSATNVHPLKLLMSGVMRILGQPLGIGQGMNPTCQSARGMSMWSQHAPAKLLNYVITAATQNNLAMRFEGQMIESRLLAKGLLDKLDYNLDFASIVLVPHLDKIYNEMMKKASLRGEDPHKWVNPAMYGEWVPIGFKSVYNSLTRSINQFDDFIRQFYASYHPAYNGGRKMIYPNPVGIFITSAKAKMLGFHAISLLRVAEAPDGVLRAYFLNPNNERRQAWGQNIYPSVSGHGERYGESSLPIEQFSARLYAFHYNDLLKAPKEKVDKEAVARIKQLAKESWGQAYTWFDL